MGGGGAGAQAGAHDPYPLRRSVPAPARRPHPAAGEAGQAAAQGAAITAPALPMSFAPCGAARRIHCVVDGDTFWHAGAKIRIADINTPETSRPGCADEARLGARATLRLTQLLNAGPFALEQQGRDTDRYGRQLRIVTRGGASIGAVLVAEGLAEPWTGRRRDWCAV
ncbi:thermonuclease family protein [Allopontixanthobacter sediminis]|uniref:Thermonuclease family protein n=1 Tax=Allopontixanthobacter sediminis TaxID=1689985 RepID=A0A845B260_9SPHN|nr:thermonuclease family protein [Allopontixanthobacter sediminis]MXP44214.1 thermonuclease family protein [Allopontixanthobacter sediminis]